MAAGDFYRDRRMSFGEEIERAEGLSGELVLRRGPAGLEIVAGGVFLVSAANAASSRALVSAAWPHVRRRRPRRPHRRPRDR